MNLTNNQLQVILTGVFGDGHIKKHQSEFGGCSYSTNCKHKEYLEFKGKLLEELYSSEKFREKNGYSQTPINTLASKSHLDIRKIREASLEENLNLIDDLGIAMWFYDDGSRHKHKNFYNLNTHAFDEETQTKIFIPFFNKFNIFPQVTSELKKDGRKFYYLIINKYNGCYEINKILKKYPLECYNYKLWPEDLFNNYEKLILLGKSKKEIKIELRKEILKNNFLNKTL